jgi:hypothetical protein
VREEVRDETPAPTPASADEPAVTPADGQPTRIEAFVTGGAYGALGVAGAVIGLLGSFYQSVTVGQVPVPAIAFALLNLGGFRLAGWAMRTRLGAVVPTLGWLLVVFFMSSKRPEGDLVVSGSTAGYVFLLGGVIGAVIAIARTRPTRPWVLPNRPSP